MNARSNMSVIGLDGTHCGEIAMPLVFTSPIRPDVIHMVQTNLAKNHRQPYAVSRKAGHQTSAKSWGTGRAVSRIPRVSGGGTQRSGHGAVGNMCRKGHMYAPTKIWRRWHRKVNLNIKRYAIASALAVSAVPAMVISRGHRVETLTEMPLVIEDKLESISESSKALNSLKSAGVAPELERISSSRQINRGRGKLRNRRYSCRKGPMLVYANDNGITMAFRNLIGFDTAKVDCLNLLEIAPGGHLGRLIIWTKSAVETLNNFWYQRRISQIEKFKKGDLMKTAFMTNSDLSSLINSDEVQSVLKPPKVQGYDKRATMKKNPLRNKGAMKKLNNYSNHVEKTKMKSLHDEKKKKRNGFFYKQLLADKEYRCEDFKGFLTWLGI